MTKTVPQGKLRTAYLYCNNVSCGSHGTLHLKTEKNMNGKTRKKNKAKTRGKLRVFPC